MEKDQGAGRDRPVFPPATAADSEVMPDSSIQELQAIYSDPNLGLTFIDKDMRFVRINSALAEMNGVSPEEHIGRTVEEITPSLADQARVRMRELEITGRRMGPIRITGETRAIPDVTRTWDEYWTPVFDDLGNFLGASISVLETTTPAQISRDLTAARKRLAKVSDNAPAMLIIINTQLVYEFANKAYLEHQGLDAGQVVGKHVSQVMGRTELKKSKPFLARALDGEDVTFEIETKVGRQSSHLQVNFVPDFGENGEVVGVIGALSDISRLVSLTRLAAQREAEARETINSLLSFVGRLDLDGNMLDANETALLAAGLVLEDVIGKPFWECFWWTHSKRVQNQLKAAVNRAARGRVVRYDVEVMVADGRLITIDFQLVPLLDKDGKVFQLIPSGIDITERKRFERDLRESERRLNTALKAANLGVAEFDPVAGVAYWDERTKEIFGADFEGSRICIEEVFEYIHSDDRQLVANSLSGPDKKSSDGHVFIQYRTRPSKGPKAGKEGWVMVSGRFRHENDDKSRKPVWFTGIVSDITDSKNQDRYRDLLLGELKHRVKNSLATIQAISNQTIRSSGSLEQFSKVFQARLQAMSAAHDIITDQIGGGVDIRDMIEVQVGPYASARSGTLELNGSILLLGGTTAHTLGLILHELATNAAKYGSLSGPGGKVKLSWERIDEHQGTTFRFRWEECGGPPIAEPEEDGFGTRLIEMSVKRFRDGRARLEYRPEGFVAELVMPMEAGY